MEEDLSHVLDDLNPQDQQQTVCLPHLSTLFFEQFLFTFTDHRSFTDT